MGKVAAVYNLVGESPETDMESIMAQLPKSVPQSVEIVNMNLKPFAFGLKIIEVTAVMNDVAGIIEQLEESLRSLPGIQNAENTQVTLI
jgi:elongation factor 1-beta